jgi:hypothetical protein
MRSSTMGSLVPGAFDPACRSVGSAVRTGDEVGPAEFDAGASDPACRSVGSAVRTGDEVGPAEFDAGVSDPACRSVGSAVRTGDEVGPAEFDAGAVSAAGLWTGTARSVTRSRYCAFESLAMNHRCEEESCNNLAP